MSQPFIGPLPYPPLPAQPAFEAWCTSWHAYDVPRMWDSVRFENDRLGWEQSVGFQILSELLIDHYRRLRTQHSHLANAWQSPAAEELLSRLDGFSTALLSDAHCAQTTAAALDGIMTTYADARTRLGALNKHWGSVTTDWVPEWWDSAAGELNGDAREVMQQTDKAVADLRTKIIVPRMPLSDGFDYTESLGPGNLPAQPPNRQGSDPRMVPPVPGYLPTSESDGSQANRAQLSGASSAGPAGPALSGNAPIFLPAMPGQPISMLPIPPGSQYSPYGGAYVLPGPGVGRGGYIVPMAPPGSTIGNRSGTYGSGYPAGTATTGRPGSGSVAGMMPMPFGGAPSPNNNNGGNGRKGNPDTVWEIEKGVPPIILPVGDDSFIQDQPSVKQEEAFKDWFAELAYPWRAEQARDSQEPQVILRRAKE